MLTFDYETKAIVGNPIVNPPLPVGVSIKEDAAPSKYYAWGHPTGNNCSFEEGRAALLSALARHPEWVAHNGPFEYAISKRYFGWDYKDPLAFHDTQYSVFLSDPYAKSFSLKPSAERFLGIPSSEQDELHQWILAHVPGATKKTAGAYICEAPGDLVGKYAGDSVRTGVPGDTDRTYLLHEKLMPQILKNQMLAAYRREQKLMPILFRSSERGIRVDRERLASDVDRYSKELKRCDDLIRGKLGPIDVDSDGELADALERGGFVTEWILTPKGARSVARKNLERCVNDRDLLGWLAYRGALATCLSTFAIPWLTLSASDGRLHTQWNQVRGDRSNRDLAGTRTGRLSSMEPNFQNVPNEFPPCPEGFLPHMILRSYLLPEEGCVWLKRDFSSQEMRIMAHFAEGKLYDAYRENPRTDPHDLVKGIIAELLGIDMPRKYVKITGFGIMYGRGVPNLSDALGVPEEEGRQVRNAYFVALPEVRVLSNKCRNRGRSGGAIRTWGGRLYYTEPNETRDLSYKLLNYLIQGSAADQTKQSIIDWEAERKPDDIFLATVHDENNLSAPKEDAAGAMTRLRLAMDKERFDVPFMSEGFSGPNWAEIKEWSDGLE